MLITGEKKVANIGEPLKCPQCGRAGRIVWISRDGKRAGIQCPASHIQMSRRPDSKYGPSVRPQTKSRKDMVFLIEIK